MICDACLFGQQKMTVLAIYFFFTFFTSSGKKVMIFGVESYHLKRIFCRLNNFSVKNHLNYFSTT